MDREIPKSQLRRARIKRLAIYGGIAAAVIVAGIVTSKLTRTSVSLDKLTLVSVDRGDVNTSVTGYGSVEPAFEEIINSPLTTRVIEVYHRPGDIVEAGTPLLLLDLETARNEYNKQLDQLAMMRLQLEQLRAANATSLGDLRMQIKVADMKLNRLRVELANERYLDSIGSGTTDRVREVEFAYKSGLLEYQQLEQQLANETRRADADIELKRLEIEIKDKELSEASRTLDMAEIRAPRHSLDSRRPHRRSGHPGTAGGCRRRPRPLQSRRRDGRLSRRTAPRRQPRQGQGRPRICRRSRGLGHADL